MISSDRNSPSKRALFASVLSLIVPGAGQAYAGRRSRGASIFITTLTLALLIHWGLVNFKIGLIEAGSTVISWLSILLAAFWLWNVADAYRAADNRSLRC